MPSLIMLPSWVRTRDSVWLSSLFWHASTFWRGRGRGLPHRVSTSCGHARHTSLACITCQHACPWAVAMQGTEGGDEGWLDDDWDSSADEDDDSAMAPRGRAAQDQQQRAKPASTAAKQSEEVGVRWPAPVCSVCKPSSPALPSVFAVNSRQHVHACFCCAAAHCVSWVFLCLLLSHI